MAEKEVILTQEGYDELVKLLDYKISVERKQVAERLNAAIALGDLSENSEYDDAKNQQAFLEGEIIDLQVKIRNAKIITKTEGDIVTLGSTVVIKDIELDEVETYLIVGSTIHKTFTAHSYCGHISITCIFCI